jgi:Icc-related predicted phosphoesterase
MGIEITSSAVPGPLGPCRWRAYTLGLAGYASCQSAARNPLPTMTDTPSIDDRVESSSGDERIMRIAAVGDLHCTKASVGVYKSLFSHVEGRADVLLLCGDLTDYGTLEEAHVLAKELSIVKVPILAVLGNHDYESGHATEITAILNETGVRVLDGDSHTIDGVGFAGVKGFCGGFGRGTLGPWGETAVKAFVKEALDEVLKLEAALARLRSPRRVAVLHYAPIRETVIGEPEEIYPFLGCSRLEEPLERYPVTVAFHGHAHRGRSLGHTRVGTPVYNVALPLLRRELGADTPPLRILELQPRSEAAADGGSPLRQAS